MPIAGLCNKSISCNVCENRVDGLAFRTACYHLLCPRCAQESFQNGMECSNDLMDAIYHNLFEQTNWSNICEAHEKLTTMTSYVTTFLFTQLTIEASKEEDDRNNLRQKAEILQEELVKEESRSQADYLQKEVSRLEHDFFEMKQAYQEKSRKCNAWSKAYENLKSQISGASDPSPATTADKLLVSVGSDNDTPNAMHSPLPNSGKYARTSMEYSSGGGGSSINPRSHSIFPTNQASADFSMDSHSHSQHQQGVAGGRNVRKRIESTTVKHTVVPAYGGHHGLLHDNDFSSVDTSAHVSRAAIDFGGGRGAYTVSSSLQQPVSRYTHASSSREVAMPSFIRHESQLISSRNAVYPRPSEGGHIVHSTKNYVSAVENSVAAGSSITSPPFVNSRAPQNQLLAHPPHQRFGDARSQSQQNVPAISDKTSSRLHSVASFRSKLMGFRQGAADNSGSGVQTDGGRFFNDA